MTNLAFHDKQICQIWQIRNAILKNYSNSDFRQWEWGGGWWGERVGTHLSEVPYRGGGVLIPPEVPCLVGTHPLDIPTHWTCPPPSWHAHPPPGHTHPGTRDTHPPGRDLVPEMLTPSWTEWQTLVKTLPSRNFVWRAVIIDTYKSRECKITFRSVRSDRIANIVNKWRLNSKVAYSPCKKIRLCDRFWNIRKSCSHKVYESLILQLYLHHVWALLDCMKP